jgi:hypothetical protein
MKSKNFWTKSIFVLFSYRTKSESCNAKSFRRAALY